MTKLIVYQRVMVSLVIGTMYQSCQFPHLDKSMFYWLLGLRPNFGFN